MLQSHRNFWNNSPGIVLRRIESIGSRDPLRIYIHDENIKGKFTPEMVDIERIIDHIAYIYQGLPLLDGDVFQCVSFASVIPWMEAIIGCHIYSSGRRGVSMVANPTDIEPSGLLQHLHYVLDNIEGNAWFKKLGNGYHALTEALGAKFPIVQTLLRGPGCQAFHHAQPVHGAARHPPAVRDFVGKNLGAGVSGQNHRGREPDPGRLSPTLGGPSRAQWRQLSPAVCKRHGLYLWSWQYPGHAYRHRPSGPRSAEGLRQLSGIAHGRFVE